MGRTCGIWEKGEVVAGFWWGNLRERGQLEEQASMKRQQQNKSQRNRLGGHGLNWPDSG